MGRSYRWGGRGVVAAAFVVAVLFAVPTARAQQAAAPPVCKPAGPLIRVPGLAEGSGVAASRRVPGRLWTHNDSGDPTLVALDASGSVTGRLRLAGTKVEDWEAVAVGPCPAGSCIYVADIGDNDAERARVTIYRVPEPDAGTDSVQAADVFHVTYPDGPHDAETLLVTPAGDVLIVTKGDTGSVAVFRLPENAKPGAAVQLIPVVKPGGSGRPSKDARITDGAVSPDGAWGALRTTREVFFHRMDELLAGTWREAGRLSLGGLGEPQGEGIAFGDVNTLYLVGEGGGGKQPGTFARLTCSS